MSTAEIVRKYLEKRRQTEDDLGRLPFVTISRQAGAGSRELAEDIVRQVRGTPLATDDVDWDIFDQELCQIIAENDQLECSLHDLLTEEYHSELHTMISDMVSGSARQFALYKKVFGVVRSLALIGNAVIIGRGGAHVCHDLPLGVHIRLVGSEEKRVAKLAALMHLQHDEAVRKVHELEKSRARLIRDFFDKDINDPSYYHAVFNIDILQPAEIAALIVHMVQQRVSRFGVPV